jgi:transcriptional regulator with XRE-family HTH domain
MSTYQAATQVDPDLLSRRIQAERLHRGWTMSELVRRTRINRGTLYRLARGQTEHPQMKTIQALARAFEVPPSSLLEAESAGSPHTRPLTAAQRFDRATNPVVAEVVDEQPDLFAGWTDEDLDELYSTFGIGGQLTRSGVVEAAESINHKRETIRKLHVVLETSLRDQAVDLVDALYRLVQVPPLTGKSEIRSTTSEADESPG